MNFIKIFSIAVLLFSFSSTNAEAGKNHWDGAKDGKQCEKCKKCAKKHGKKYSKKHGKKHKKKYSKKSKGLDLIFLDRSKTSGSLEAYNAKYNKKKCCKGKRKHRK